MFRNVQRSLVFLLSAVISLSGVFAGAQQVVAAAAPIPSPILTGRKVFISNTVADEASRAFDCIKLEPIQAYAQLYATMKEWGHFELVSAPIDADLVFEIRFIFPTQCDADIDRQLGLKILDAKTHFTLWTMAVPVQRAALKGTWERNLRFGIRDLVSGLQKLVAEQPVAGAK